MMVMDEGKKGKPPAKNLTAERRRRQRLNYRLYRLSSVIPKETHPQMDLSLTMICVRSFDVSSFMELKGTGFLSIMVDCNANLVPEHLIPELAS